MLITWLLYAFCGIVLVTAFDRDCLAVENGDLSGALYPNQVILQIPQSKALGCICRSIGLQENISWVETANGVRGPFNPVDCGSLRFMAKVSTTKIMIYFCMIRRLSLLLILLVT